MMMILTKWLNSSFWLIDGTLTGTTILGPSGPGSNGNERTGTSPSDAV